MAQWLGARALSVKVASLILGVSTFFNTSGFGK